MAPALRDAASLRALWARGQAAAGAWTVLADPVALELLARAAWDYVVVDLQHGFADRTALVRAAQGLRAAGVRPLVRVAWNEPAGIMAALDAGAAGVVVPMVDDADAARRAVQACRYPPAGRRSWGPLWGDVLAGDPAGAPEPPDADPLCVVMVETRSGLAQLAELLAVEGVDGVYVGPNDLALDTGHGRVTYRQSPAVERMLQDVVDAGRAAGVPVGLHCTSPAMGAEWASRGAAFVTVATDSALLRAAADDAVEAWRSRG